jgi:hypothetical protein
MGFAAKTTMVITGEARLLPCLISHTRLKTEGEIALRDSEAVLACSNPVTDLRIRTA